MHNLSKFLFSPRDLMNDKEDLTDILKYMCSCGLSSFLLDLNDPDEVESFGLFVLNIDSRESMNIFTHFKRLNYYFLIL